MAAAAPADELPGSPLLLAPGALAAADERAPLAAPSSFSARFDAFFGLDAWDRRRLWAPRFYACGRASRGAWRRRKAPA